MQYKIFPRDDKLSIIEQIFKNRGMDQKAAIHFLNPAAEDIFSAHKLDKIEDAAKLLCRHLAHQNKIFIQVDSDCDGYTSAAVLINYLHRILPNVVENTVSYKLHNNKHHGLIVDTIPEGTKLVIAPDSSSNEPEVHKQLSENGIDILVLDHHVADKDISDPALIINNQICNYPNKNLSGVGIVYKLCKILDEIFKVSYADDYLDLVALGLTADMMDIRELETHYYITEGFNNVYNVFFKALVEKQSFLMKDKVNPFTVSWYIAPLINAMTRSGEDDEKLCLFEALLDYKVNTLVQSTKRGQKGKEELLLDQAIRTCSNVKNRQERNKEQILNQVLPMAESMQNEPILIIKLEVPIDENLNGLIANQIMGQFNKPVLVLNKTVEGNNIYWKGSGRGLTTELVTDWRGYIESTRLVEYAQGHDNAFGVCFLDEKLEKFQQIIREYFNGIDVTSCLYVDLVFEQSENFDSSIKEIGLLNGIWGQNIREPLVMIKNIQISKEQIQLLKKGTVKITIPNHDTTCIKFNSEKIYNDISNKFPSEEAYLQINLFGSCSINEYMGQCTPQLKIQDYEISKVLDWVF